MSSSFRDLVVWRKAKKLSLDVYRVSKQFPRDEIYGLTSQTRRAAISVVSNIAEGQGRLTRGEFLQHLGIARGSLFELHSQLEIATDLGYVTASDFRDLDSLIGEVRAMLLGLIDSLKPKSKAAGA
jgi:four helix bundle protein